MIRFDFWLLGYVCFGAILFLGGTATAKGLARKSWSESLVIGFLCFLAIPLLHLLTGVVRGDQVQDVPSAESAAGRPKPTPHVPDYPDIDQGTVDHRRPDHHVTPEHEAHVVPRIPEHETFHPIRKLFRSGVEFTCGMLGIPGAFLRIITVCEIGALLLFLAFCAACLGLFLKVIGVLK